MSNKNSVPPLVRLGHPMAFSAFLRNIGAPLERHLHRHRLPVLCEDPNAMVPLPQVWGFFDTAARHEDPMLGWRVGAYVGDHNLDAGLLSRLESSPTLLQAFRDLARLARTESSNVEIGIYERRKDVLFYTRHSGLRQMLGYSISQTYQLGVILDLIRTFLGRHWMPNEVGIESALMPSAAQELFPGCRILTRRFAGYIAVPRSCLHCSACRTASTLDDGEDVSTAKDPDYAEALRSVLNAYISEGYPTQQFASMLLNTSVRTLSRKLADRGLTYGALIDDLRFTKAKENLQNPDMRIGDVAQSVGFTDQGDFTRMFRRIGGLTPKQYRSTVLN
jgi:AraC-like DNA-binding protein